MTHGSHFQRHPVLSVSAPILRVLKGVKMAGHMGNERVTVKNLPLSASMPSRNPHLLLQVNFYYEDEQHFVSG